MSQNLTWFCNCKHIFLLLRSYYDTFFFDSFPAMRVWSANVVFCPTVLRFTKVAWDYIWSRRPQGRASESLVLYWLYWSYHKNYQKSAQIIEMMWMHLNFSLRTTSNNSLSKGYIFTGAFLFNNYSPKDFEQEKKFLDGIRKYSPGSLQNKVAFEKEISTSAWKVL